MYRHNKTFYCLAPLAEREESAEGLSHSQSVSQSVTAGLLASCNRTDLGRDMVQAVSNRTGVVRLRSCPWGFFDRKYGTGTGSVLVFRFSPVIFSPPICRTRLHLAASRIRRTSGRSIGTFKESSVVSDVREHFPGTYCHIIVGRSLLHYFSFVKDWGK